MHFAEVQDVRETLAKTGSNKKTVNTGDATLEIHIEKNAAKSMMGSRNVPNRSPVLDRTKYAKDLSKLYLFKADAITKPPNTSTTVGCIKSPKTKFATSGALM
eukprot:136592_1